MEFGLNSSSRFVNIFEDTRAQSDSILWLESARRNRSTERDGHRAH